MLTADKAHVDASNTMLAAQQVTVVVPTYNAEPHWHDLQASLDRQGLPADRILIIDSSSRDRTFQLAQQSGYRVLSIPKSEFGHGSTRQMACDCFPEADLLLFLTQDALLPNSGAFENLCRALEDPAVGAAYGRQAPRANADPIERHARLFNYPESSHVRTFESRLSLGIKAAFCSNSFAVYRRAALMEVGGFPRDVIMGEDSVVAARLLMAGWKVVYEAEAVAVHSHPLRLFQEFRRYFDTGVHHSREGWLLETFGEASPEGRLFVRSELRYLLKNAPLLLPVSLLRTCNKLAAYRLGRMQRYLPLAAKRRMSGYSNFWSAEAVSSEPDGEILPAVYKPALTDPLGSVAGPGVTARGIDPSASM